MPKENQTLEHLIFFCSLEKKNDSSRSIASKYSTANCGKRVLFRLFLEGFFELLLRPIVKWDVVHSSIKRSSKRILKRNSKGDTFSEIACTDAFLTLSPKNLPPPPSPPTHHTLFLSLFSHSPEMRGVVINLRDSASFSQTSVKVCVCLCVYVF